MESSGFINLNSLTDEAKKELENFYEYLIFKYKKKLSKTNKKETHNFNEFLTTPIKSKNFKILNREERNER